jgi:NAD dependent epimerase/dehydratase family enzyme
MGQMGEESLLYSQRIAPAKLERTGFAWKYGELRAALQSQLLTADHRSWQ